VGKRRPANGERRSEWAAIRDLATTLMVAFAFVSAGCLGTQTSTTSAFTTPNCEFCVPHHTQGHLVLLGVLNDEGGAWQIRVQVYDLNCGDPGGDPVPGCDQPLTTNVSKRTSDNSFEALPVSANPPCIVEDEHGSPTGEYVLKARLDKVPGNFEQPTIISRTTVKCDGTQYGFEIGCDSSAKVVFLHPPPGYRQGDQWNQPARQC